MLIIILILINTHSVLHHLGKYIIPNIENTVRSYVSNSVYRYVYYIFDKKILINEDLLNIVNLHINSREEVVSVDYNLPLANKYLLDSIDKLYENLDNLHLENVSYYNEKKGVFFVPVGIVTNNFLLNNLGFRVPCMVNVLSNVKINFRTKVNDYGLNNLLIELYLTVDVNNEIVSPNTFYTFKDNFEILIASKVVVGNIPAYYGGMIEKSSAIVSS